MLVGIYFIFIAVTIMNIITRGPPFCLWHTDKKSEGTVKISLSHLLKL